jgi:hypothetical protein
MSQHTTRTSSVPVEAPGPVGMVALIAFVINVFGLFSFTGVALCVFGYIALTILMMIGREHQGCRADNGDAVILLSWVVALAGGAAVGALHWVHYRHAACAVLGVYGLAVLIWIIAGALSALRAWLYALTGVAMLVAVLLLGAPPGADDMERQESWTPLKISVVDSSGNPVAGATVYLDLLMFWQSDPELDADRECWCEGQTGQDGVAHMQVREDPRFKRLLIRVRNEPFQGGSRDALKGSFNEPFTIGGWVGHRDARLDTSLPTPKLPYSFTVVMEERPHPDSAILEVQLESEESTGAPKPRGLRLALTREEESLDPDEPGSASGGERNLEFRDRTHRRAFRLTSGLAARPLRLHVLERTPGRVDGSYTRLGTVSIDPIPLGASRLVKVMIPSE